MSQPQNNNEWRVIGGRNHLPSIPSFMEPWAQAWPGWQGGYENWAKDLPPNANVLGFLNQVEELRHATMLEF